ncbi:MAG TPA: septum formation initiator family protein [Capillimicrobium sp.]|jgi:cell division protein FtsB
MAQIRWDRVGRVALLCVLVGIVALYVGPARSYFTTKSEAAEKHSEVLRLEEEHRRLLARKKALSDPATLEQEARALGYVKPGEKAYAIEDLPGS